MVLKPSSGTSNVCCKELATPWKHLRLHPKETSSVCVRPSPVVSTSLRFDSKFRLGVLSDVRIGASQQRVSGQWSASRPSQLNFAM
jgi:hypothetical protein